LNTDPEELVIDQLIDDLRDAGAWATSRRRSSTST